MTDNWTGPAAVAGIIFLYVVGSFAVCCLVGRVMYQGGAAADPLDDRQAGG